MSNDLRFCTICEKFIALEHGAVLVEGNKHGGKQRLWITPDGTAHLLQSQRHSDRRRTKDWRIVPPRSQTVGISIFEDGV